MTIYRERAVFINEKFFQSLILYIGQILCQDIYNAVVRHSFTNIFSIIFQVILLVFIFDRGKYTKPMIKLYCVLTIAAYGWAIWGGLSDYNNRFSNVNIYAMIMAIIEVAFAILILDFTNRTVVLKRPEYLMSEEKEAS
ncbi:hypothetical protein [Mucilaginibacter agri]|uniref:Uncharacterized protein n=1 Tax=Mucilaginibacter agri TaxID=2695265 RepID=A0A965ZHV2_9SPHI|nr:hypothetical protein [Mucilaginibacter agri]NCD69936.1 hypothetical protein [Mucilaginibacter agri]